MKKFIKQLIIFSTPLVIYLITAIVIDPYNVFYATENERVMELKLNISNKLNYPLFKLQQFENHPSNIILLGDSRIDKISESSIEKLAKIKASNLGYGGGTLPEMTSTFWYIAESHDLKKVIFGINFHLYNANFNNNRVNKALELKKSPLSYIFSQYSFNSIFYILKSLITRQDVTLEKPILNRQEFWDFQLEHSATAHYSEYIYPNDFLKELLEISNYCKSKKIEFIILIPPTHIELQKRIDDFGLIKEEQKFKNDMKKVAKVYDFDNENDITKNKNNFLDPYHFNDSIADIIIAKLFINEKANTN